MKKARAVVQHPAAQTAPYARFLRPESPGRATVDIRRRKDGMWQIEDAESLNELVIQGQRFSQHVLNHDDRIHLSPRVILRYVEFP